MGVVDYGGKNHNRDIDWLAPAVEYEVENEKCAVAVFFRQCIINAEYTRQIYEHEEN